MIARSAPARSLVNVATPTLATPLAAVTIGVVVQSALVNVVTSVRSGPTTPPPEPPVAPAPPLPPAPPIGRLPPVAAIVPPVPALLASSPPPPHATAASVEQTSAPAPYQMLCCLRIPDACLEFTEFIVAHA